MTHGQAGKGDRPRPVDAAKYGANYDRIFRMIDKGANCPYRRHRSRVDQCKVCPDVKCPHKK